MESGSLLRLGSSPAICFDRLSKWEPIDKSKEGRKPQQQQIAASICRRLSTTTMRLPPRCCYVFLLFSDISQAFIPKSTVPKSRSVQNAYSTLKRHQDVDRTSTRTDGISTHGDEEWLTKGLERDSLLRKDVVIGPKEILVYDTTLRGRSTYCLMSFHSDKNEIQLNCIVGRTTLNAPVCRWNSG